jgi:hypothetical protein
MGETSSIDMYVKQAYISRIVVEYSRLAAASRTL